MSPSPTSSAINFQHLQQQLRHHLVQQPTYQHQCDLRLLAHGESNLTFRLNEAELVRVAVFTPNDRFGGQAQQVTQFEGEILQYLAETGIGHRLHQAVIHPPADFGFTYLITNYLEGRSLNYSRADLEKAAHTLAQLHRLPQSPRYALTRLSPRIPVIQAPLQVFYQEAQHYAQPYLDHPRADPDICAMVNHVLELAAQRLDQEAILSAYPYTCLVHSDHTYENWVVGSDRAYLIDWEWAEISSPAGDLGHFLSPITVQRCANYQLPDRDRAWFLNCYYTALDDPKLAHTIRHHVDVFGVFPAVRSLCWTVGYWLTEKWYGNADSSPSAADRLNRLQQSQQRFPDLYEQIVQWLQAD